MNVINMQCNTPTPLHSDIDAFGWLARRADNKFSNFADMIPFLEERTQLSNTKTIDNRAIQIETVQKPQTRDDLNKLAFTVEGETVGMSHWSFNQLAGLAKSPSKYLRSLPAPLVKDCLEYSLRFSREIEDVKIYTDKNELRAVTGPGYGRVIDSEVAHAVQSICDDGRWQPADKHMGFSATDRSMNLFLIDKANPIVVGRAPNGEDDILYRGLRIVNSEVGAAALSVEGFLFRNYCLNGMIFGMGEAKKITVRHSKNAPYRWVREVKPAILNYADQDGSLLIDQVQNIKAANVASDNDAMVRWINNRGLSINQAKLAVERVQIEEGTNPRSVWDAVQGITAIARDCQHVEDRATLERVAGKIWERAA